MLHFTIVYLVLLSLNSCAIPGEASLDNDALELDKSIRTGRLPNGFTYYIKPTDSTDEISLRFCVKVGTFNEELWKSEQYAHLMEHLGYIEGYLNSHRSENAESFKESGVNTFALTSRIHTPYWSSVHSNDVISLNNRIEWFYNIANMKLEDSLILREARCVRQEMFYKGEGFGLTRSFKRKIRDAAIFFNESGKTPYTDWISSYDMGGISAPSVREFYQRWYRPDRMGLIITGKIKDIDSLEQQLIAIYGKIPIPTTKHHDFDLRLFYLSSPTRFKTVERTELNQFSNWNKKHSELSLFFRVNNFHKELDTKRKWLDEQLNKALFGMIYQRLIDWEVPSWPLPTQTGSVMDAQIPDRNYPYFRMPAIESKPGAERENLQRVTSILQHLSSNGFTQQEWDARKQIITSQITREDISNIKYWEKQIENHFVYGEILPAQKQIITKQWIDSISLKDINSYLRNNFSVMPDDIFITASKGHPALSFKEKQVRGWIKEAIQSPLDLKRSFDISSLIPLEEKKSPLMSSKEVEELEKVEYKIIGIDPDTGLDILKLSNGIKILLDHKEPNGSVSESISITGSSPRGALCFPEEDYYSAISSTEIIKLSGAGGFSRKAILNRMGRKIRPGAEPVQLYIKNNTSTVSTRAKFEDLEKHLQLIYLYFTSPRKDSLAFTQWKKQLRDRYFGNIIGGVSPRIDLKNAISKFLDFKDFGATSNLISTDQFYGKQKVRLEKALECFQAVFGNASDFTFIVRGRFEKKQVLSLLQKYLGNLPVNEVTLCETSSYEESNFKIPKGPIYHTFYSDNMGAGYRLYTVPYILSYIFPIPENNWKDRVIMDIINIYLNGKVGQELRFLKGASVYYETVEGLYSKEDALYSQIIHVDTLEDELDWIQSECHNIIAVLKDHGISAEEKARIIKDPLFFGRYLATPKLKSKVMKYANSLTSKDIKRVARKYLKENHQYEFVFRESEKNIVIQ